ncbi:MAG: DEAD/DEAH box helicase [Acidobacteria bacterium]|nr:DEAD/DEAH box helicase [Acidobacteriota bacterium]
MQLPIRLRDYQSQCLTAIFRRYKADVRRQLVCLPTGTGKTVIFAQFPSFFRMKRRMLVLAHRAELLHQAREKLLAANPALKVEIEQAGENASEDSDVIVASVPTLGRRGTQRLMRLNPDQFSIVVIDEAHHSTADTYRRIVEHLGLLNPDTKKLLVGFTATPKRSDGIGLDAVFDEIAFSRTIPEMMQAGYLAAVAGYRVETDVDLSRVKTSMGDFVVSQLSDAVNIERRNALVVKSFRELVPDRKTLVFCVDVAHALDLAAAFKHYGISAAAVTGSMPADERSENLAAFSSGRLQVLTNCMVLTEGYDEPAVDGIILARPTKSTLLYTQMIGRGTRTHPGKTDVTVVDVVDNSSKHRLITLPSLFGLAENFNLKGRTTSEVERAIRWVEVHRPWVKTDLATDLDDLRLRCTRIDLMELRLPDELRKVTQLAWAAVGRNCYRLGLGQGEYLTCAQTVLDRWEVVLRSPQHEVDGKVTVSAPRLETAIAKADSFIRQTRPLALGLADLQARWRRQPVTEKQLERLKRAHLKVPPQISRGQASHLIAMLWHRSP